MEHSLCTYACVLHKLSIFRHPQYVEILAEWNWQKQMRWQNKQTAWHKYSLASTVYLRTCFWCSGNFPLCNAVLLNVLVVTLKIRIKKVIHQLTKLYGVFYDQKTRMKIRNKILLKLFKCKGLKFCYHRYVPTACLWHV